MKKGNKLYSILKFKCPKCHEGDLFVNQHPYSFRNFFDMPEHCSICGQKFELETGFYYGAMYVSYGLTIAISIALWVAISVFIDISWWLFFLVDVGALVLLVPWVFKVSRSIWANLFIHYKEQNSRL